MASESAPEPVGSSPDSSSPDSSSTIQAPSQAQSQPELQPEKFTLPTSSRSPAPQVLASEPGAMAPARAEQDEATKKAVAQVLEREARARLLALRRIEWVAIGLATVLLGGATYSWRTHSDERESRRQAFNLSPVPRPRVEREEPWRAARPAEVKAASQAIKGQLDAFKRDDYEKAATWQSEELKHNFASVQQFRRLIKQRYPAFAAYKSVRFGQAGAQGDGTRLRIQVALQGPADEHVSALYALVREGGAYHIEGVIPIEGSQPQAPQDEEPEEPSAPLPPVEAA